MPRLKLTIAYVGTHYCGWQVQAWKDRPNPPTIQGEMERVLADIVGRPVHVQGAGRTDSGVHADAQVAHCDVPEEKNHLDWVLALNTRLPHDIRVTDFAYVPDEFNACFSVSRKAYTYALWLERRYVPPRLYPFVWGCGPLDLDRVDAAIPHMVHEKRGRIISITSMWGTAGASCEAAYSASKAGVHGLTRALAKELAPSGIQVNALACGVIDTRMNDVLTEEDKKVLAEEVPAGRFGTPEEVAESVWFLANAPSYLTGQIIGIDGGFL